LETKFKIRANPGRIINFFKPTGIKWPADLNKEILKAAASKYKLSENKLVLIRAYESYIFEAGNVVLRLSKTKHRSFDETNSQAYWQQYLHVNLPQVVEVLPSASGKLAEHISVNEESYTAVLIKKSEGKKITDSIWNTDLFMKTGKLTGKLHALTKLYHPDDRVKGLNTWHTITFEKIRKFIPPDEYFLVEKSKNCFRKIGELPVTVQNFGIIHNDLHRGNMFICKNEINLFDFDDTCYSWFINDIAGIYFHALLNNKREIRESKSYLKNFISYFLEGYKTEHTLYDEDLNYIPELLAIRAISNYSYLNKVWDFKNLNHAQKDFVDLNRKLAFDDYFGADVNFIKFF